MDQAHTNNAVVKFEMEPPRRETRPSREYLEQHNLTHVSERWARSAIDIEDRFWPRRARLKTARKSLPALTGFCSFWGVSQALRDCIERLESGVHEVRPVQVLDKDGTPFDEADYALNIRQAVPDAMNWERTQVPSGEFRGKRQLLALRDCDSGQIVMRKMVTGRLHLWISEEVILGTMAVSDGLHELFSEHNGRTNVIGLSSIMLSDHLLIEQIGGRTGGKSRWFFTPFRTPAGPRLRAPGEISTPWKSN